MLCSVWQTNFRIESESSTTRALRGIRFLDRSIGSQRLQLEPNSVRSSDQVARALQPCAAWNAGLQALRAPRKHAVMPRKSPSERGFLGCEAARVWSRSG